MSRAIQPFGFGANKSGGMRCPKCRTDMEQVEFDGVEIDRCKNCNGMWFDVGESDALKNIDAATAIDIGDSESGRQMNEIDRYRCPRCDGGMMRMVDPRQSDIWYEECTSCKGTFFDAGEFRDLSEQKISSFLKRLATPERK